MQPHLSPNDVAIFLDLDNVVIAANEARLSFDINIVLDHVKESTQGRVVLRRAYGDWRQNPEIPRQIAAAGFEIQSAVRLTNMSKNLADMQLIVDAVETLIDGYSFRTYVIVTGDRDFMPLIQTLRKRGKHVIGVGIRHATSSSLANLCDEYVYYDDLSRVQRRINKSELQDWLAQATDELFKDELRVRASVLRDRLDQVSDGAFANSQQAKGSFSKLLEEFPELITLERDGTTLYVTRPETPSQQLHRAYRSALKRHGLRVVPSSLRLRVLKDIIAYLQHEGEPKWHQIVEYLANYYADKEETVSKSRINDVLRVARRADVIKVAPNGNKPLAALPVSLALDDEHLYRQAVMRCDAAYLCEIKNFDDVAFDIEEAAVALYDSPIYAPYIQIIHDQFCLDKDAT